MSFKKIFFFILGILFVAVALLFAFGIVIHTPHNFSGQAEVKLLHDDASRLYWIGLMVCGIIAVLLFKQVKYHKFKS